MLTFSWGYVRLSLSKHKTGHRGLDHRRYLEVSDSLNLAKDTDQARTAHKQCHFYKEGTVYIRSRLSRGDTGSCGMRVLVYGER